MAFVVGLGVCVAYVQLSQWKREKIAVKRSELGEDLVSVATDLIGKVSIIRSPFGYGPPEGEEDDGTYDYRRRLRELAELDDEFAKLRQLKIRSKAWIGDDSLAEAIDAFFDARGKLIVGINGKIREIRGASRYGLEYTEGDAARSERYDLYVWEGADVPTEGEPVDPILTLLNPALDEIERKMIPLIRLEAPK
ncbi:hypothetical protein [Actibacterium atlanticum]|nr:hypothetical protein [Actibacterium atlanticum]